MYYLEAVPGNEEEEYVTVNRADLESLLMHWHDYAHWPEDKELEARIRQVLDRE